jgi:hypothetical protein
VNLRNTSPSAPCSLVVSVHLPVSHRAPQTPTCASDSNIVGHRRCEQPVQVLGFSFTPACRSSQTCASGHPGRTEHWVGRLFCAECGDIHEFIGAHVPRCWLCARGGGPGIMCEVERPSTCKASGMWQRKNAQRVSCWDRMQSPYGETSTALCLSRCVLSLAQCAPSPSPGPVLVSTSLPGLAHIACIHMILSATSEGAVASAGSSRFDTQLDRAVERILQMHRQRELSSRQHSMLLWSVARLGFQSTQVETMISCSAAHIADEVPNSS